MSKIKISIVVSVWGTEALLKRSIKTWAKQDFPKEEFEIIVCDDNALGDVKSIIEPYRDKINMQYIRFEHSAGMRGGQLVYNVAYMSSAGIYIGESTPETMWTPNFVRGLYEAHEGKKDTFVMFKTYNLTPEIQLDIDKYDWESNIMNISKHPDWENDWVQRNKKAGSDYGSHQSSSIHKETWYRITNGFGHAIYSDYGSCDPAFCGLREQKGIDDLTVLDPLLIHQWHLPFDFFTSLGHAPLLNKNNHSIMNVFNDVSGRVPEDGSSAIWDNSDKAQMSEEKRKDWRGWDQKFLDTGGDPAYLEPKWDYYKKHCYYL